MRSQYILRGLDADGNEMFYTGKAGTGWVSVNRNDAFTYHHQDVARDKAKLFNTRMPLHGLRFIALDIGPDPYREIGMDQS